MQRWRWTREAKGVVGAPARLKGNTRVVSSHRYHCQGLPVRLVAMVERQLAIVSMLDGEEMHSISSLSSMEARIERQEDRI